MSTENSNIDRVAEGAKTATSFFDSIGQIGGAIKWVCILAVVLVVGWGSMKVHQFASNVGAVALEVGGAVVDAGVEGVTDGIEAAGENAAAVREAAGEALTTATEGIDTEALADTAAGAAEAADDAVDGTLGWLQQRRDQLGAALDGDRDTTVTGVPDPVTKEETE